MSKTITSTELQKNTRNVIDLVRIKGDPVVVETYGKPMVFIVDYNDYQNYLNYQKQLQPSKVNGLEG